MQNYTQHALSKAFPAITEVEYADLLETIRQCGQYDEIITYQGRILHGNATMRACLELGLKPRVRIYEGNDPARLVLDRNLNCRRLSKSQRAIAVVICSEWQKTAGVQL